MRRRSSMAPIRPCELFDTRFAENLGSSTTKSVVPRQLDFNRNPSRTSITGKPTNDFNRNPTRTSIVGKPTNDFNRNPSRTSIVGKPANFRASITGPQRSQISLSGRPRNDVSVMDGVSLLGQTINESSASDDITIQILKPNVAASSYISHRAKCPPQGLQQEQPVNEPMQRAKSASQESLSGSSKSSESETKIPKPKFRTAEKTARTSAELNSTAAFEGEEIAALTSTPHPDRKSKSSVKPSLSSVSENSELAEQMKLFIMDQRNLMQTVKLSFQKMNSVMDQMNTLLEKLNSEADSNKLMRKSVACNRCVKQESNSCEADQDSQAVNNDKENVGLKTGTNHTSLSMFCDMKSENKCLKTPTALRTRQLTAETPITILSNTVHNQLENLFETSETDS